MKNIITVLAIVASFSVSAQRDFKANHDFGLNLSTNGSEHLAALSWKQVYDISKNEKFRMGYGARINGYLANNQDYITAPAHLTSGERGPQVFFIENIQENLDTFSVAKARHYSLNAVIYLEYAFSPKWTVGFNIDAAGITVGPKVTGTIISSEKPTNTTGTEMAKPTAYNVLLISDNDIGMLNSELYMTYNLNNNLSVNAGLSFLFTEYTTENQISYNFNNDRFRRKSLMGMIGVNYRPFK